MKHLDVCLGWRQIIWGGLWESFPQAAEPEFSELSLIHIPLPSMGLVWLPIHEWLIFMVNVGRYTIHGCYGIWILLFICPRNWGCLMYPWRIRVAILHLPTFAIHTPYIGTTFGFELTSMAREEKKSSRSNGSKNGPERVGPGILKITQPKGDRSQPEIGRIVQ